MKPNALRLLAALAVGIAASLATPADAYIECSGPYYNSRSWNSGGYPHEGGCYLAGAICYECWDHTYTESAGCEWSTEHCQSKLEHGPFNQYASFLVRDEKGLVTKVCVALIDSDRLDETALS